MKHASGLEPSAIYVDGGMTANSFLMQFQSDLCQIVIHLPSNQEQTALGAAKLAAKPATFSPKTKNSMPPCFLPVLRIIMKATHMEEEQHNVPCIGHQLKISIYGKAFIRHRQKTYLVIILFISTISMSTATLQIEYSTI